MNQSNPKPLALTPPIIPDPHTTRTPTTTPHPTTTTTMTAPTNSRAGHPNKSHGVATRTPSPPDPSCTVARELEQAASLDPGLRRLIDTLGYPEPRVRPPGFATLLRVIVSQQLSTSAAAGICTRLETLCRGTVTPRKILNRTPHQLRLCGLSRQKITYAHDLATRVSRKTLDLDAVAHLDTESVITELTKVRGIGRWSAEIYAMFALRHPDLFPSADLALQVAIQRYNTLPQRPSPTQTATLTQKWSPHRSSVALLMWKYYGSTTLS